MTTAISGVSTDSLRCLWVTFVLLRVTNGVYENIAIWVKIVVFAILTYTYTIDQDLRSSKSLVTNRK